MHIHKWDKWKIESRATISSTIHGGDVGEQIVQVRQCQICGLRKYKKKTIGL
jgi:hypothetical protein